MHKKCLALGGVIILGALALLMWPRTKEPEDIEKQQFIEDVLAQVIEDPKDERTNYSDEQSAGAENGSEDIANFDKKLEQKIRNDQERELWTEAYKRYDVLPNEEKESYSGAIPSKYKVPMEALDRIEKDQENYDLEENLRKNEDAALNNPTELKSVATSGRISSAISEVPGLDMGGPGAIYQDPNQPISGEIEYDDNGLPKSYDLRNLIEMGIDDQMHVGLCWDFAATNTLETFMGLHGMGNHNLSEVHANVLSSEFFYHSHELDNGGDYDSYEQYLLLSGPTDELEHEYNPNIYSEYYKSDDTVVSFGAPDYDRYPFVSYYNRDTIDVHITKYVDFPTIEGEDKRMMSADELERYRAALKKHIIENGAIYFSVPSSCINRVSGYIYCKGADYSLSHAMAIIGWIDDLDTSAMLDAQGNAPAYNGVYIVKNSWGEGDQYFYMPYDSYDAESDMHGIASNRIEDAIALDDLKGDFFKNYIREKYSQFINVADGKEYVPSGYLRPVLGDEILSEADYEDYALFGNKEMFLKVTNYQGVDLEYLKNFTNLQSVTLDNVNDLSDEALDYIANKASSITIRNTKIESSDFLSHVKSNAQLTFENVDNLDLDQLQDGQNLSTLKIIGCTNVRGLNNLGRLGRISDLRVSGMGISSISELNVADIKGLFNLSIEKDELTDFSGLPEDLYMLTLTDNKLESYPEGVNVRNISISHSKIANISNVSPSTEGISISDNEAVISSVDVHGLGRLHIHGGEIESFNVFKNTEIDSLELTESDITEITPIDAEIGTMIIGNSNDSGIDSGSIGNIKTIRNLRYLSLKGAGPIDMSIFNDYDSLKSISLTAPKLTGEYSGAATSLFLDGDVSDLRISSDCKIYSLRLGYISESYLRKLKSWNIMNPESSSIFYTLDKAEPLTPEQYDNLTVESGYSFYNSDDVISARQRVKQNPGNIIVEIPVSSGQEEYSPAVPSKIQRVIFSNIASLSPGNDEVFKYGKSSIKSRNGPLAGKELLTAYSDGMSYEPLTIRFVEAK